MDDDALRTVLRRIDEGTPVDWAALESGPAAGPLGNALPHLQVLSRIAGFHRALHAAAGSLDAESPQATSLAPASTWGPLDIVQHIGAGSYGDVYRAWDRRLDREVALKLLRRPVEPTSTQEGIVQEGRQLARMRHANVVSVYGADVIDGRAGIWMELVRGQTAATMAARGPLPWRDAMPIAASVADALAAVHAAGLVHGDINAKNVMRDQEGRVVLMDFGAARHSAVPPAEILAGTPLYLAPEIFDGGTPSRASDIYAVGVLCYFLVTGTYPVAGDTIAAIREAHLNGRRRRLGDERADIPASFAEVVDRALDPDPGRRFASAAAMASALAARPEAVRARTGRWLLPVAIATAAVLGIGLATRLTDGAPPASVPGRPAGAAAGDSLTRRVPLPDTSFPGRPSPDGRYFPFVDSDGAVAVLELDGHRTRQVIRPSDGALAFGPTAMSPDSRSIAYTRHRPDRTSALHVVDLDDGTDRMVRAYDRGVDLSPVEWSADGRRVLVMGPLADGSVRMALIDAADGGITVLKDCRFRPQGASLSPDGLYLAYDAPEGVLGRTRDIHVLRIDDRAEWPLVTDASNDLFPQWTSDGTRVVFVSDRTESLGVWVVAVASGVPAGEPAVVERELGRSVPFGLTRDGSFFYFLKTELIDVYTAVIDPRRMTLLEPPRPIAPARVGAHTTPDWSADGRYLAYVSLRGLVPGDRFSRALSIRDVETNDERDLWPPLAFFLSPRWSPDNRALLVLGLDLEGRSGIHRIDAATGDTSPVVVGMPGIGEYEWAPDGRGVLYRKGATVIQARDLTAGTDTQVLDLSRFGEVRLVERVGPPPPLMLRTFQYSPDGRRLAFTMWRGGQGATQVSLAILSPDAATPIVLHTAPRLGFHGWTADGTRLLFTMPVNGLAARPSAALWSVPAGGGPPERVGLEQPGLSTVRLHPDQSRLAFVAGFDDGEMRVAERLLNRRESGGLTSAARP